MTATFVQGDHVSCSRVGGAMRRESSRLHQHAQSLADALGELATSQGPAADVPTTSRTTVAAIASSLVALRAVADDLDQAGAAVQRYATDLAEAQELGRRAVERVAAAGLRLEGTRAIEPWGPASAREAEGRRAQAPEAQARVDQAAAYVGRARGRLLREATRLTEGFSTRARAVRAARSAGLPAR